MTSLINDIVAASLETKRRYFEEQSDRVKAAAALISSAFREGGKLLLFGNGGSSCDAQHIAGEFVNRFLNGNRRALPALSLSTDGGVLTCLANDTGFENVFARQVEAFGSKGDVCLAISTSGNSANVVAAIKQAKSMGLLVIGMLGRDGGQCAPLCDLALTVQHEDTQRIQETHNLIGHILCELVELDLFAAEEGQKDVDL